MSLITLRAAAIALCLCLALRRLPVRARPLAVLAGSGLPALVLYLALVISLAVHSLRKPDAFSRAVGVSVLLYSVQGFFSFSICLVSPMAWAVFGMACADGEGSPGGFDS